MATYYLKQSGKRIKTPVIRTQKQARLYAIEYNKNNTAIDVLTNVRIGTGQTVPIIVAVVTFRRSTDPYRGAYLGKVQWTKDTVTHVVRSDGKLGRRIKL